MPVAFKDLDLFCVSSPGGCEHVLLLTKAAMRIFNSLSVGEC